MPAYYAIGHLSGALFPTIGEHPHAKTPNSRVNLTQCHYQNPRLPERVVVRS